MPRDTNIVRPTQIIRQDWLYGTSNSFPIAPNNELILPISYDEITGNTLKGWWTTELILKLDGSFSSVATWDLVMDWIRGLTVNYKINGQSVPYWSKTVYPAGVTPPTPPRSNFNVIISDVTGQFGPLQVGQIRMKIKEQASSLKSFSVEVINPLVTPALPNQDDRVSLHSWIELEEESQHIPDCPGREGDKC